MSKIVMLFYAPIIKMLSYYNQFATAFKELGHDVICINSYTGASNIDIHQDLIHKIIQFNPDLIISYNHMMDEEIYKKTHCPVIVVEADAFFMWHKQELLKKYQERCYIGVSHKNRIKVLCQDVSWFDQEKIIVTKNSTILKPENLKKDINISCIATLVGQYSSNLVRNMVSKWQDFNYISRCREIFKKAFYHWSDVDQNDLVYLGCSRNELFCLLSAYSRSNILDNVADLGLNVYGQFFHLESILNLQDLFFSLKNDPIQTMQENQDLYNKSIISLNVHFVHNSQRPDVSGYSWRVCDIMATTACLVSTECPALDQDFGKWVKIPQFSNKHEAYEICKKLLQEDNWRSDVIAGSQLALQEGKFLFYDRVKELESRFNLKGNKAQETELIYEYVLKAKHKTIKKRIKKLGKKIFLVIYTLSLETICSLPFKIYKKSKKILKKHKQS